MITEQDIANVLNAQAKLTIYDNDLIEHMVRASASLQPSDWSPQAVANTLHGLAVLSIVSHEICVCRVCARMCVRVHAVCVCVRARTQCICVQGLAVQTILRHRMYVCVSSVYAKENRLFWRRVLFSSV